MDQRARSVKADTYVLHMHILMTTADSVSHQQHQSMVLSLYTIHICIFAMTVLSLTLVHILIDYSDDSATQIDSDIDTNPNHSPAAATDGKETKATVVVAKESKQKSLGSDSYYRQLSTPSLPVPLLDARQYLVLPAAQRKQHLIKLQRAINEASSVVKNATESLKILSDLSAKVPAEQNETKQLRPAIPPNVGMIDSSITCSAPMRIY